MYISVPVQRGSVVRFVLRVSLCLLFSLQQIFVSASNSAPAGRDGRFVAQKPNGVPNAGRGSGVAEWRQRLSSEEKGEAYEIARLIDRLPLPEDVRAEDSAKVGNVMFGYGQMSEMQKKYIGAARSGKMARLVENVLMCGRVDTIRDLLARVPSFVEMQDTALIREIVRLSSGLNDYGDSLLSHRERNLIETFNVKLVNFRAIAPFCKVARRLAYDYSDVDDVALEFLRTQEKSLTAEQIQEIPFELYRRYCLAEYAADELELFKEAVAGIPPVITLEAEDKVDRARSLYDEMPDQVKGSVALSDLQTLRTAEQGVARLNGVVVGNKDSMRVYLAESKIREIIEKYNFVVYFHYSKFVFGPESREIHAIRRIVRILDDNPEIVLEIHGYASLDGASRPLVEKIAYERAMSVMASFLLYDAPADQMVVCPHTVAVSADQETLLQERKNPQSNNRRVDFSVRHR